MMRTVRLPGDKSLSHRALILGSLATGTSRLRGLSDSHDVAATARCLRALGVALPTGSGGQEVQQEDGWDVDLTGPAAFQDATALLDCGNSGTTARLLAGLSVGLGVSATLDGDPSLRARPMDRVVYPLQAMGGRMRYLEGTGRLPLGIDSRASGGLRPLRHRPRVASAQVKSALLLAGLVAEVRVEVVEPGRSRDHTERLLQAMGAPLTFGPDGAGARALLEPREGAPLSPLDLRVPGDPSSAAFLLVAALLAGRSLRAEGISLNPTRTGFLEVLEEMGVAVRSVRRTEVAGEPIGDVEVRPGDLRPFSIGSALVPRLLDEVPALVVLAARADGTSRLEGAGELRLKESDRLARLAGNLEAVGIRCRERRDGLEVEGRTGRLEGTVRPGGDHRIAMAFAALGASPGTCIRVEDRACVAISFPRFWEKLEEVVK